MTDLEQRIAIIAEEYQLAGEAIFDVNIAGSPELEEVSDEVLGSIRNAFATGYSFGAIAVLQASFAGTTDKIETPLIINPFAK